MLWEVAVRDRGNRRFSSCFAATITYGEEIGRRQDSLPGCQTKKSSWALGAIKSQLNPLDPLIDGVGHESCLLLLLVIVLMIIPFFPSRDGRWSL